ncbi:hypothetical protein [Pseudomonas sp. Marseille-P9899]|uniref:hypothetical protein n=1 Tax=Pseudomonas sp. Marseille-P9899 TaxID=2730401 RepID=UPI00158BF522|nr:hypothetical protein [Pseudomonas sp. Marseille-P9899]
MKINPAVVTYPSSASASQKAKVDKADAVTYDQAKATTQTQTDAGSIKSSAVTESSGQTPLEAYALPGWLQGFGRDLTNEGKVGTPGTYVDPKNVGFASASPATLSEYSELLQQHLSDVYERSGLTDINARYKAMSIPGLNDRLHQEFNDSISSDARMMSLMDKLGVKMVTLS